jgi:hypothetical protein
MSNVAPQPFDPYHKWLGIPPAEQPPTCYRLLGIPLFESDPDVIDAAADQRMAHLRKYQTGANSALSQQLLNEVASARIVLHSPEKKAAYDAELRAKTAAASRPAETKPVVNGSGESSAKGRGKAEPSSLGKKRPPKLPVAVPLDSPTPAAAAPVPAAAVNTPAAMTPAANPEADTSADAAFTPLPMARATQPKPQSMSNLIVGISVAAGIALLGVAWLLIQNQGAKPPIAPTIADSAGSRPASRSTVAPASPAPLPHRDEAKIAVREIPPSLLDPPEGAVLCDKGRPENQGKGWDFRWSPLAQAVKYHLRVTGPSDNDPLIDNSELTDPSYHCNGIVSPPGAERRGWRWKVRAMVASQTWSDWSSERKFDVEPEPPPRVVGPVRSPAAPDTAPKPVERPKETPAAPAQPETPIAETPARAAVPDDAALAKALKAVLDIYAAEYDAARSAAQKVVLAKKFLEQSAATRNDPAACYVLIKSARDLASQAGDAAVAFQAIDEMSAAFEVDGTKMKADAVSKAAKAVQTPAQLKALVDQILALMDELVDQDRFDDALALAPVASERARRTHDNALSKQINQHKKEVDAIRKAFVVVQPLAERLSTQPDDAEANYRVGRYSAAVKSDWRKGLPMLAKGSDASWKKLAQQELASPSASGEQLALADGWWDAAELAQDVERNGLLLHAGTWYRKAQPGVAPGLKKARVEKRLAEIDELDQPARAPEARRPADFKVNKWVDIFKRVDVARDQVAGQWKRANEGIAGTGGMAYTRLMLPVAVDGSYDLQVGYALRNVFDQGIVVIPVGSRGCAIYFGRTIVGIYANQQGPFAGGYRVVTSRAFVPNALSQHVLGIGVRLDGDMVKLAITFDTVLELTWAGPKDFLDLPTILALPSPGHPGLGTMQTDTPLFRGAMLRLVSGKASWVETKAANKLPLAPADERGPRNAVRGGDVRVGPDDSEPLPLDTNSRQQPRGSR